MAYSLPNIVFVFPDQFRQQALGCMGADPVITPRLDRFAAEGRILTRAVSNYPVCSPYRAMLLTGKYPYSNGVVGNCNSETAPHGIHLRPEDRCLTDVLHDAGYTQGYIGKFHLDAPSADDEKYGEGRRGDGRVWDAYTPPGPRRHGVEFWHSYGCCDKHFEPHYWHNDAPLDSPTEIGEWSVKHETDVAVEYILNRDGSRRPSEQPFSLFVAFNPPHTPFNQVPERYVEMYGEATSAELLNRPNVPAGEAGEAGRTWVKQYFAAVTGIDEQFGRILDALDEAGLRENTIVVFTADHGEMMGSHGCMHKGLLYDESFLVPFLIRWPGRIPTGPDDLLLSVPDILPTLLGLAELGNGSPDGIEGMDCSLALRGEEGPRPCSALFLAPRFDKPLGGRRGVRTHRWAFATEDVHGAGPETVLFDCRADPFQMRNLASEHPEIVAEMGALMREWLARTGDPWADG